MIGALVMSSCKPPPTIETKPAELQFIEKAVGKVVSSDSAYQYRQQGGVIVFLSVRERQEWDEEHIPGAVWIPHSKLKEDDPAFWDQVIPLAQTHKYLLAYCGAGRRSGYVTKMAQERGLSKVYNLGGISF